MVEGQFPYPRTAQIVLLDNKGREILRWDPQVRLRHWQNRAHFDFSPSDISIEGYMARIRRLSAKTSTTPRGESTITGLGKDPQSVEMWPDVTNQDLECSICTKGLSERGYVVKFRSRACQVHKPVQEESKDEQEGNT